MLPFTALTRSMRSLAVAAAIGFGTTLAGVAALPVPAAAALRIPSGEIVHLTLSSSDINTQHAQVGQRFTMNVVPPYPGGHSSLQGATVYGHVAEVRSGGQGRKAQLKLAFDRLVTPNGETGYFNAKVTHLDSKSQSTIARKGLGAGVGAAVGSQTIGRILGGTLGSVVGIVGGAAGGYMYGNNDKPNFNVAAGAAVTIETTDSMYIRHQS